jgi:N-acetyl-alpha-D-muramate 1-phosphate uridylyltransferase
VGPLPPVCILAGGLGTRLGERVRDTPKGLIEVAGEPFLCHQLRQLADHGAERVVLCVGYLGELIEQRIGERFGLEIAYSFDSPGLDGTLGAIRRARDLLGERFLVLYGDTYLRIDYAAAVAAWSASALPAMMSVLRNDGRFDASNALYGDGLVLAYDKRAPRKDMRWIDYGLGGLEQRALDLVPSDTRELSDLYSVLARERLLRGYEVSERFFEIGTPAALAETDAHLLSRSPAACPPPARRASPVAPLPSARPDPPVPVAPSTRLADTVRSLRALRTSSDLRGQGARYALAGCAVATVYLLTTTILAVGVGLPFQVALISGFAVALSLHFTLQRLFVWTHRDGFALPFRRQMGRYLLTAGAQYGLTAASTSLLPPVLGLAPELVYLATAPILTTANFLVFRHGVFHPKVAEPEAEPARESESGAEREPVDPRVRDGETAPVFPTPMSGRL